MMSDPPDYVWGVCSDGTCLAYCLCNTSEKCSRHSFRDRYVLLELCLNFSPDRRSDLLGFGGDGNVFG